MYALREKSQQRVLQHLICLSASNVSPDHSKKAQKTLPKAQMKQKKKLDKQETRPGMSTRLHHRRMEGEGVVGVPGSILRSPSKTASNVSPDHSKKAQKTSSKAPMKRKKELEKQETRPHLFTRLQNWRMEGEGAAGLQGSILRSPSKTFQVTNDSRPRVKRITWKIPQVQVME